MFTKALNELIEANKTEQPLLYCFIIPRTYFKYDTLLKDLNLFLAHNIMLKKEKFPYKRYNRSFDIVTTSPIVDTHIIICHTKYINNYINYNISIFNTIIDEWIKKNIDIKE